MTLYEEIERNQKRQDAKKTSKKQTETDSSGFVFVMAPLLLAVNILLTFLVRAQYNQTISAKVVFFDSIPSLPVFAILITLYHPFPQGPIQYITALLCASIGCYLVYLANEGGYYMVMKSAPHLATLWVWLHVELNGLLGCISTLAVFCYTWWMGYRF